MAVFNYVLIKKCEPKYIKKKKLIFPRSILLFQLVA